jgi:hypothetical protein
MSSKSLSIYQEPKWGARATREVLVTLDDMGSYTVETRPVTSIHTIDLFSVLVCADGTTYPVLTAFLRQIGREIPLEP